MHRMAFIRTRNTQSHHCTRQNGAIEMSPGASAVLIKTLFNTNGRFVTNGKPCASFDKTVIVLVSGCQSGKPIVSLFCFWWNFRNASALAPVNIRPREHSWLLSISADWILIWLKVEGNRDNGRPILVLRKLIQCFWRINEAQRLRLIEKYRRGDSLSDDTSHLPTRMTKSSKRNPNKSKQTNTRCLINIQPPAISVHRSN